MEPRTLLSTFSNFTPITINDAAAATPYPSNIAVAGFPAGSTIDKVTVTIHNFSHTFPQDVDMLLVGPGGQNAIIWSDVGGDFGVSADNLLTITLDDAAASFLPDSTSQLTPGTFRPTNIVLDGFPAPAPLPAGGSFLSVFNGGDPNGTWSLYVVDDLAAGNGAISGWSLNIATEAEANLRITKSASSDVVIAGEELFYNIHVFNEGPNTAINAVVTDTLPTGVVFLGDTAITTPPGGCTGTTTLTCNLGNIPAFASRDFKIKVRVPPDFVALEPDGTKTIINTATVSSISDSDPSDDTSSVATFVEEKADLRITKIVEPAVEAPAGTYGVLGDTFTYTIYVDNLGPSAARNVTIRDTLLNSTIFGGHDITIQSCAFSVSQGGGAITQFSCTTGPVVETQFGTDIGTFATNFLMPFGRDAMGDVVGRLRGSFRLSVKDGADVTTFTRVFSSTPDPESSNNDSTVNIKVTPVADIQAFSVFGAEVQVNGLPGNIFNSNVVTPMPDPACCNFGGTTVTAGRRIQWDTSILNAGPSSAENVRIEVLLPFGASIIENTLTGVPNPGGVPGRCFTESAGELRTKAICVYPTLKGPGTDPVTPGDSAAMRFLVLVDPSLPVGTQLSFDSIVSSDTFDPNLSNNITSIQFDTNAFADLLITKTDAPDPVLAGNDLTYTLTATNRGPSDAQNVQITDTTPANTTFSSAIPSPGGFCVTPDVGEIGTISCTWSEATDPAGSRFVILQFHVDSSTADGTIISNTASVSASTPDPFLANNSALVTTTVDAQADLAIDKSSNQQKVDTGTQTSFTIFVENLGPSDAVNVVVVDTLPVGVTFETDTDSCVEGPVGTLTCSLGTLQPGESRTFDIFVFVDPSLPPNTELTNTATVSSDTPDPDLSNNTDTSTILALRTDTDLQITKDAPATAEIGTLITYIITVTNVGSIPATNVEMKDFLPVGLRPQSYSPSVGNCLAGVVGDALRPTLCNLGTLAPGDSAEIIVEALVANNVKDLKQLFNDALVTSAEPDTNPEDNLVHSTTTAIQTANGNVSAKIFGGNLVVTGDIFNNKLRIEAAPEAGPDAFRITPFGGTKLNGRFESYQVHGVRLYASFNMQSGNDGLFFDGPLTLRKSLNITLGQGNDRVEFFDTIVRGNTHIVADGGADTIVAVDALFGGRVDFRMGSGADDVSILNSKFNSALDIRTGSAKDTVTIESSQVVGKLLVLNESHSDLVTLIDSVFSSFVELQGGTGLDTLDAGPSRGNTFVKGKTVKSFEVILP